MILIALLLALILVSSLLMLLSKNREEGSRTKLDPISCVEEQVKSEEIKSDAPTISQTTEDEFSSYPFLKKVDEVEPQSSDQKFHRITSVYSPSSGNYYVVLKDALHTDEVKLSELRVRLYESYCSPQGPLLTCARCGKPVLLKGKPGIKGEIVGFSHYDEGTLHTGLTEEPWQPQAEEDIDELNRLRDYFCAMSLCFDSFKTGESFLVLPGTDKRSPGDIRCVYNNRSIAVLFATASHPLDFIIRRVRNAYFKGFTPIFILGRELISNPSLTVKDISAFSGGFVYTVDETAIQQYYNNDIPTLIRVDLTTGEEIFIDLDQYITTVAKQLTCFIVSHPAPVRKKQVSVSEKQKTSQDKKAPSNMSTTKSTPVKTEYIANGKNRPRPAYADYWQGRRTHIKDDLYLIKIGESYGILNMKTQRCPILPIYDKILVSEDKSHIVLVLKGKETEQSI